MPYSAPFRPPRLKLERAKHHINEFNRLSAEFFKTHYRLVMDEDAERLNRRIRPKNQAPIPSDFALVAGDGIHNLRSALDLLCYHIVSESGKPFGEQAVSFPIRRDADPERLEAAIKSACIHFAGESVVELFKSFQPYPGGHLELYELDALDVIDKHRLVLSTAEFLEIPDLFLPDLDPLAPRFHITNMGLSRVSVVASWSTNLSRTRRRLCRPQERDLGLTATVIFDEGPFASQPIETTLRRLTDNVEGVIDSTERLLCS